jgi:type II secretory pathway pseudopilin PulG
LREERGAALIVALLVAFVVMMLSTLIIDQAIHNTDAAGANRARLTSVSAAEAGLNYYYNYLGKTEIADLSTAAATQTLGSDPGTSSFTATPTFYADTGGTTVFSGTPSASNYPRSVKIVSVGTTNDGDERTMETFIELDPIYGGLEGAVVTNSDTTFSNNFTINGYDGNDGDVYVTSGDFSVPSGLETIKGSVYVKDGDAYVGTSLHLYGDLWANGSAWVDHSQADVDGAAKSTTSSVTVSKGNVDGGASYCTGSAPPSGTGTVSGSIVQTCALGAPPVQAFPQIPFTSSAWTDQGYTIQTFSGGTACTAARNYIEGSGAGTFQGGAGVSAPFTGVVVRITDTCTYSSSNNATITVGKNLAIVTDGGINLNQRSTWNGSGGTKNLYFMSPWPSSGSPSCPTQDITLGNNTGFNSSVWTFVYTPCTATMNNNNSAFQGQVIGTSVTIGNLFNMNYKPILVPGAQITGFDQDIAYIREVR